jgi:hypothetical protein
MNSRGGEQGRSVTVTNLRMSGLPMALTAAARSTRRVTAKYLGRRAEACASRLIRSSWRPRGVKTRKLKPGNAIRLLRAPILPSTQPGANVTVMKSAQSVELSRLTPVFRERSRG